MNQRLLTVLIPQGLEEGTGHIVEFDDRNILSLSHSSHGIRIILMSLLNLAMGSLIEEATLSRSYEDDVATLLAYLVDEFLQIIREVIPGTTARILLLLIVMTELTNHVVALLHHRQHLVQTIGGKEGTCSQSAFGMVGDSYLRPEPSGNHLSPGSVWLCKLIYYRRVAAEENGGGFGRSRFHLDALYCWGCTCKLQGQLLIPGKRLLLARFDLYVHFIGNIRRTLVHDEGESLELPLPGTHLIEHQSSVLGTNHSLARFLLRTEHHGHLIVAIRHLHGIEERRIALCLWSSQDVISLTLLSRIDRLRLQHINIESLGIGGYRRSQRQQTGK